MCEPITDLLLGKMFFARAVTLWAGAALAGLALFAFFADRMFSLPPSVEYVWLMGVVVTLIVIPTGSLFTWYYLFYAGLREGGLKYAIGHLLLCTALTPIGLAGIILIPLVVFYDIERWRESVKSPSTA
jgi:hypothetical protein